MEKELRAEIIRLIEKCEAKDLSRGPVEVESLVQSVIDGNARLWSKLRDEAGRAFLARLVKTHLNGLTNEVAETTQLSLSFPGFENIPALIRTNDGWLPALKATRPQLMEWRAICREIQSATEDRAERKEEARTARDKLLDKIIRTMAPASKHDPSVTLEMVIVLKNERRSFRTTTQRANTAASGVLNAQS
jgi:hypothetical protein